MNRYGAGMCEFNRFLVSIHGQGSAEQFSINKTLSWITKAPWHSRMVLLIYVLDKWCRGLYHPFFNGQCWVVCGECNGCRDLAYFTGTVQHHCYPGNWIDLKSIGNVNKHLLNKIQFAAAVTLIAPGKQCWILWVIHIYNKLHLHRKRRVCAEKILWLRLNIQCHLSTFSGWLNWLWVLTE